MAQFFDIPIAFDFYAERPKWTAAKFVLTDEGHVRYQKPNALALKIMPETDNVYLRFSPGPGLRGLVKPEFAYKTFSSELVAELEIMFEAQESGEPLSEAMTQVFIAPHRTLWYEEITPHTISRVKLDPWKMRDEFMSMDESNVALLSFLNRWGIWNHSSILSVAPLPLNMGIMGLKAPGTAEPPVSTYERELLCVLPFAVWKARESFRSAMLGTADSWLSENASLGMTHRRTQFPYLGITDTDSNKAIQTTITLDHMRNVKRRICARPDCNNIFTVESDHGKIYCEQYCGHVVSQRRKRAAAKKARKS